MEPESLGTAVDLQEQVQISPQKRERGGPAQVAKEEASRPPKNLFAKSPMLQIIKITSNPKKLPISEKFTAVVSIGRFLAASKDFMKWFFYKSSRKMKPRRDFMSHFQQNRN